MDGLVLQVSCLKLSRWWVHCSCDPPPLLWIPLGLWPACLFLEAVQTWQKLILLIVFSALLHSSNGPLNIFINLLHTFLSLMSTLFFSFDVLFGRLSAVGFNKFVYLIIDISARKKKWLYSGGKIYPQGPSTNTLDNKWVLWEIAQMVQDPWTPNIGVLTPHTCF